MNNTEKLLRAFIEASGYDVREVFTRERLGSPVTLDDHPIQLADGCVWEFIGDGEYQIHIESYEYKVTKKPFDIISEDYTDEMSRLHMVIRGSNEYNKRLYLSNCELKKELSTLKTGKAFNE
jgi:hypothetical protein